MRDKIIPLLITLGIFVLTNVYGKEIKMKISSTAFAPNGRIPKKYTCDGPDVNPPLKFEGITSEAKSLVLVVDDPDAPAGTWVHWVLWNIDPKTADIRENSVPENARQGINDFRKHDYGGPCPPSGTHRYFFKLYCLDTILDLGLNATKGDIESSMKGHILEKTELIGLYNRSR